MDMEKQWWDAFGGSYGVAFEKACPDYDKLDRQTQIIGALMKLELDMYNGGFIQFFCNWGYSAYLLAVDGLEHIGANTTNRLLQEAYSILENHENDDRIKELWDIPKVLSDEENKRLNQIDHLYWENTDDIMLKMMDNFTKIS